MTIQYSKVNQAWLIMWLDKLIAVKNTKMEVYEWLQEHGYNSMHYEFIE